MLGGIAWVLIILVLMKTIFTQSGKLPSVLGVCFYEHADK